MKLISIAETAEILKIQEPRVERLIREHLLKTKDKDEKGNVLLDEDEVKAYKALADRIGGI